MTRYGYTLLTEQFDPRQVVRCAAEAEGAGFDFEVMSDHYFPWLTEQGHSGYAWSMLGAVTQVTERIELMTFVTSPIMRYHPAVVAQKAATVGILSDNRFTLGLGAGENLNEHVIGEGWPPVNVRHEMLSEATQIIRALLDGGYVNFKGEHYRVDSAKLWDLPEERLEIGVAVSGDQSVDIFSDQADHLIAVEPNPDLVQQWDGASNGTSRKIGQLPICWDTDRERAVKTAHEQFRWFAGGWKVNAELPGTAAFDAATQKVRPEDVAESIPCGPDLDVIVRGVRAYEEAGFTDVALVQIGSERQDEFCRVAHDELLPALRGG